MCSFELSRCCFWSLTPQLLSMAMESQFNALLLTSVLLCKLDKCEDSPCKMWISGLLTLVAIAAYLACNLANNETLSTVEELKHVQEELAWGTMPIQAAFKEVFTSQDDVQANGSDCPKPQANHCTKATHPMEAIHMHDHLSTSLPDSPDTLS